MQMSSCLVDTNILLRITRRSDPQHKTIETALARLAERGTVLCFTQQNIAEFWNAMTRPTASNGLGLSIQETDRAVRAIESGMSLLPDNEMVYREWRRIVCNTASLELRFTMPA
jgi:predicted nucleic acid-binding protein